MANDQPASGVRRLTARFEGHVQGVGFRFSTMQVASRFAVTGYVQNEMDGSVSVVAEGAEKELVRFLRELKASHVARYVTREDVSWSPATGEFATFGVRYGW